MVQVDDSSYEEGGNDYPLPYVRWTEKRNFEAVLNALSNGTLNLIHYHRKDSIRELFQDLR